MKQHPTPHPRNQLIAVTAAAVLLICLIAIPRLLGDNAPAGETNLVPTDLSERDLTHDEHGAEFIEPEDAKPAAATRPATGPASLPALEIERQSGVSSNKIGLRHMVIEAGKKVASYTRETPIAMGAPGEYAELPGVTTFRGNHWRDNSAYGLVPDDASELSVAWTVNVGAIDDWAGVGWTGQAAIVRWPDDVRRQMNIKSAKRDKDGLREVIIAALDGKIRFLDLDDGEPTRTQIDIGAPIKGSVTVDPRGYPLLYCGQGLFEVGGRTVKCGTRIFSLIDGKLLYFLNGKDKFRPRNWYCFDAAPLVDAKTDTLIQVGENGIVYTLALNTDYDRGAGQISIQPKLDRWTYKSKVTARPGMENSVAVYSHYAFFADNSGLMTCLDLNTMSPMWCTPLGDDTDATTAIEQTEDRLSLYTANELDLRSNSGNIQMRCIDGLTGKQLWKSEAYVSGRGLAGSFASPAVGKRGLSDLVFFHIAKTSKGGTLFALDKRTGKTVWAQGMGAYGWSTPALMYDSAGTGYVLVGSSSGTLRLMHGLTGKTVHSIDLKNNIEGSPAVYDDMAVVSTRGGKIIGVRIS